MYLFNETQAVRFALRRPTRDKPAGGAVCVYLSLTTILATRRLHNWQNQLFSLACCEGRTLVHPYVARYHQRS